MMGDTATIESFRTLLMRSQDKCQTLNPSSNLVEPTIPANVFPYDTGNVRDWYDMDTTSILGEGSSSIMYKCFERGATSKPPCACKVIRKADPFNTFPKIQQEVKILFALLHQPNIITLHDVFEDTDHVYLVMELGGGGELFEDVKRRMENADCVQRPLSPLYSEVEVASIMFQIMSAIQACHSVGIIHRDVKPENVLIVGKDDNGFPRLKVIDFGLSTFTQPNKVLCEPVGTPLYMAPEVAQQAYGGHEADVWSAGCIMFVLLCGYHPFLHAFSGSLRELVAAQTNLENLMFRAPSRIKGFNSISNAARDLLRAMLMVEPSLRLTADEFFGHPWITHHMGICQNLQTKAMS